MAKSKNKKNTRTKSQPYTNKSVPKNISRAVNPAEVEAVSAEDKEDAKTAVDNAEIQAQTAESENAAAVQANEAVTPSETDIEMAETEAQAGGEKEEKSAKSKGKVTEVKAKDVAKSADKADKKKKDKAKKPNKLVRSLKNTGGELKKVTWPTFKQVVKQTGIVLAFVVIFALVLFGFDRLCAWLVGFLY